MQKFLIELLVTVTKQNVPPLKWFLNDQNFDPNVFKLPRSFFGDAFNCKTSGWNVWDFVKSYLDLESNKRKCFNQSK